MFSSKEQNICKKIYVQVNDYAVTISPDQSKGSVDDVALPVVPEWKHDTETKSKGNRNVSETDGALSSMLTNFFFHDAQNALLTMRKNIKEKELEALLAGKHDSFSYFMEVQAGAGGTESVD
ncbi:unnamed protein product [Fraxinus pennsylvanica]|uniref:Peptide chain release factor domain-containing protein n=1 Tax=Fraxinus pennsylvanica TaxID=56036 RepID=A0AAD1ZME1_9LAMI|nr:unnamed protein product [Fraxinus pennsylvanica]